MKKKQTQRRGPFTANVVFSPEELRAIARSQGVEVEQLSDDVMSAWIWGCARRAVLEIVADQMFSEELEDIDDKRRKVAILDQAIEEVAQEEAAKRVAAAQEDAAKWIADATAKRRKADPK